MSLRKPKNCALFKNSQEQIAFFSNHQNLWRAAFDRYQSIENSKNPRLDFEMFQSPVYPSEHRAYLCKNKLLQVTDSPSLQLLAMSIL
jgi:hypothetical protein